MKKIYLVFIACSSLGINIINAQFTDLLDFNFTNGANPYGSLTASVTGDTLYGTAAYGGAYSSGCVFSIHRDGSNYTDLLDFDGLTDGAYPFGTLTLSADGKTLYGTTSYGIYGQGNVFSINTDATSFNDIHEFTGTDGSTPYGSVSLSTTEDSLYILNSTGGNSGYGDVFCVTIDGSWYADVMDFDGYDGAYGYGSLTFSKGYLFGMTSEGGYDGYGNIFVLNPHTLGYADLYDFDGYSGYPYGDLTASVTGDTLFGMTSEQGIAYGNVFGYILGGGGYQDLYEFTNKDGNFPEGDLTLARSGTGRDLLYGMTSQGGANDEGTLFSIKTDGSRYKDLFDFSNTNGIYPYGSVTYLNDTMYGLCSQGGADNDGLFFRYGILIVDSFHLTSMTCTNGYLGSASVYPAGGVSPYTYYWTPGGNTNQTVTGLSAGTYTAVVTDNTGSRALSVAVMRGLSVSISEIINVSCNGGSNGSIQATPWGGTAPYRYSWTGLVATFILPTTSSGVAEVEGPLVGQQPAGTYTITISDSCGNSASTTATITQPPILSGEATVSSASLCYGNSDSLFAITSGGTLPYSYYWFPPTSVSCNTCQNVSATPTSSSEYYLIIVDNNGCIANSSVNINIVNGLWTGTVSTDWNDPVNWCGAGVPTDTTHVVIPAGTPFSPTTNTGSYAVCAGLMISTGATLSNPEPLIVYGDILDSGSISANSYIGLTGNWTNPGKFTANTYTVTFFGTSIQTINGATNFSTLDINNLSGVTGTSPISVTTLTIGDTTAGSIFFDGGNQLTSTGTFNLENSSKLKLGSSTATTFPAFITNNISSGTIVEYSSSSVQTISAIPTYDNLILSGGGTKMLGGNTTVNDTLTLSSGSLPLGPDTLTLGADASVFGASSSAYIQTNSKGTLRKLFNAAGSFNYPVGDNAASTDYTPISVTVSSASFPDYINVTSVPSKSPYNTSSSNYLNRYWQITQNASGSLDFNTLGTYLPGDVVGTESDIFSAYSDTAWTQDTLLNPSVHATKVTDVNISSSTSVIVTGLETSASLLLSSGCHAEVKATGNAPYTYSWSNGATTSSITPTPASDYTVTVHDAYGITATMSFVSMLITPIIYNASCYGLSTAIASSAIRGGFVPYTYSWSDGSSQATETATGLSAGTYTVLVTDNAGCNISSVLTITEPAARDITISSITDVTCNRIPNGSATAVASGGTPPYTYSWSTSPSQTTSTATGLSAGTYTITFTDINRCVPVSATVTITQPPALVVSTSTTPSCNGLCNGSATATPSGGTSPYIYSWSNGTSTISTNSNTGSILCAGTYTITVTDNNGCTSAASAIITQPAYPLGLQPFTVTNVSCNGGNGSITAITATGGTPPFTYLWSPGSGTSLAVSGSAGTYTLTVTDNSGCSASSSAIITQPAYPLGLQPFTVTNVSCNGGNGSITAITATGGTPPFTYLWSPGSGTSLAVSGSAGTYTLTVTDNSGCSASSSAIITQPANLTISTTFTNVICHNQSTGDATVNPSGGTSTYAYSWSTSGTNSTITALSAGTYTITVTDSHACSTSASVIITQPPALSTTATVTANDCNGNNDGSALASPSGGTPPFIYSWNDGGNQTSIAATGLSAGTYTVTVTDNCSATASASVIITQPAIPLIVSTSVTNACGGNNGTATANLNISRKFIFEPAVQNFTVPSGVASITVTMNGASGGDAAGTLTGGGSGASFTATCAVTYTDVYSVAVGQGGGTSFNSRGAGGGGATWLYDSSNTPPTLLAVAAGGGGSGYTSGSNGGAGGVDLLTNTTTSGSGTQGTDGSGGSGGSAGTSPTGGGGGAGWYYDGGGIASGTDSATGGHDRVDTFYIANYIPDGSGRPGCGTSSSNGWGGYGGGGQGGNKGGGGGGGYNGGAGGNSGSDGGDGGGSYLNGTLIGSAMATNIGSGNVTISYGPGGTPPFTYLWNDASSQTTVTASGLSGGTYTVTVTDNNGCSAQAIAVLGSFTSVSPAETYTVNSATEVALTPYETGVDYRWDFADLNNYYYAGVSNVANIPVWPLNGDLIFYADSNSPCAVTYTVPPLASSVSIPGTYNSSTNPYPRWSKRSMDVEVDDNSSDLLNGTSSTEMPGLLLYCSSNNITQVILYGMMEDDGGHWVFGNSANAGLLSSYATGLQYLINALKTIGVEEVAVGYEKPDGAPTTNDEFTSVLLYNSMSNFTQKVDFLCLDEEFWTDGGSSSTSFNNDHLPTLKNMYRTARYCDSMCFGPSLRVEDFYNWTGNTTTDETDSICKYTDRILYAEYESELLPPYEIYGIYDPRWFPGHQAIGRPTIGTYYKKEIWPMFSAEDYACGTTLEYSGYDLYNSTPPLENDAEWVEYQYFKDLNTNRETGPYAADTNFQVLGDGWFQYDFMSCLTPPISFGTTYWDFTVMVGPDRQWTPSTISPITVTATVSGGTPPFTYTWFNVDNGRTVFYSTTTNSCTVEYNALADNYEVQKLGVVVTDGIPENAADYLCIYEQYTGGAPLLSPIHHLGNQDTVSAATENTLNSVKVYPNPNNGQFIVNITGTDESVKNIEIYTIMGQKIFSQTLLNVQGNNAISLYNPADGVCFYRVTSENGKLIGKGKLLIEK